MSSVIALNQIDGSELWKKVGFKHSEKVLVALRGVYNLPFNLDDPVITEPSFHHILLFRMLDGVGGYVIVQAAINGTIWFNSSISTEQDC